MTSGITTRHAIETSLGLAALVFVAATSGCSSATAHVANTNVVATAFDAPAIALPPVIEYLDAESGKPMAAPPDGTDGLAERLQRAAVAELADRGIAAVETSESRLAAGVSRTPEQMYTDLKALRSASVADVFRNALGPEFDGRAVLATRVRFHRGPSGSWNINTGQITSPIRRMVVDAHVYDLDAGREVWQQTVQLRTRPSISDKQLREVVARLFGTLTTE